MIKIFKIFMNKELYDGEPLYVHLLWLLPLNLGGLVVLLWLIGVID